MVSVQQRPVDQAQSATTDASTPAASTVPSGRRQQIPKLPQPHLNSEDEESFATNTVLANNCRNVQNLIHPLHRYSLKNVYTTATGPETQATVGSPDSDLSVNTLKPFVPEMDPIIKSKDLVSFACFSEEHVKLNSGCGGGQVGVDRLL